MVKDIVYLDNAATTRTDPAIAQALCADSLELFGNPSSKHALGVRARDRLNEARRTLETFFPGYRVVFTASGSEALNLGIRGAFERRARGTDTILVSAVEHPGVGKTAQALETHGAQVLECPVGTDGRLCLDSFERMLCAQGERVAVVAIMAVQNELGSVMPLADVAKLVRSHAPQARFVIDGVQALGKLPMDLKAWSADSCALSSHKIHGPKGVGCLLVANPQIFAPLITGGGQEHGLRSGTENVPAILGFARACAFAITEQQAHAQAMEAHRVRLLAGLRDAYRGLVVHGPAQPEHRSPAILSVSFPQVPSEILLHALEEDGVYCSAGSACSAGSKKQSHVHKAIRMSNNNSLSTVRFGLSWTTTSEEIDVAIAACKRQIARLLPLVGQA